MLGVLGAGVSPGVAGADLFAASIAASTSIGLTARPCCWGCLGVAPSDALLPLFAAGFAGPEGVVGWRLRLFAALTGEAGRAGSIAAPCGAAAGSLGFCASAIRSDLALVGSAPLMRPRRAGAGAGVICACAATGLDG